MEFCRKKFCIDDWVKEIPSRAIKLWLERIRLREEAARRLHEWREGRGFWLEQGMARLTSRLHDNFWFSSDRLDALDLVQRDWLVQFWHPFVLRSLLPDDDDEAAIFSMICVIYLYLYLVTANWGGTKTYNPGTTEFRATYVSLLLFRGSYVWIKFRDVARTHHKSRVGYVYPRTRYNGSGTPYLNYEPRYTPPGKKNRLSLGEYAAEHDAEVVLQFAKFQFDGKADMVDLGEDFLYFKTEQECNFSAQDKWAWIPNKAKEVLEEYQASRARVAGGGPREVVDAAVSSEDVGATTRPEQIGADNLTGDIMADKSLNPFHDMPVDDMYRRADDMIVEEGTPLTEGRENEQPNLQNEQLEDDQQQQPRQIQPSLEQPPIYWLENPVLRDKNDVLKNVFEQVRKLLGLPSLQPPLRSNGENFTQLPLEEQNSELSAENQRLKSILWSVIDQQ